MITTPRRRHRPPDARKTFAGDLREDLLVMVRAATMLTWPSEKYAADPVGFCRDILGFEPWELQRRVMRAVVAHPLVSVKSGHRVGKSWLAGALALWFYCSFPDARVVCTGPTSASVQGIIWRAIKQLFTFSGRCLACNLEDPTGTRPCPHGSMIDGRLGERAATGLVSDDFREIRGYTVKDVEAITGTAGANLLFIMDEASGVSDAIFEGLHGNRAGWSSSAGMVRMLLIGNPTKTVGEFYDSHEHPRTKLVYHRITVSSRETPNVVQDKNVIPGLATREWIDQMEAKYGEDSSFVKVRVDGEFPVGEDGKAFSIAMITDSQQRHDEAEGVGMLQIGMDPAGESGTGDETAMAARRGDKIFPLQRWRGLTEHAHAVHLLALIEQHREHPREKAIVVIDSEGHIGARVYAHLAELASRPGATFEIHRVRASEPAFREPMTFAYVRDELAHELHRWMKAGGALPEDEMLEAELHALEWERGVRGRSKITPKKAIRKALGRSPDSYDAVCLAVWPVLSEAAEAAEVAEDDDDDWGLDIDPYGGAEIDPYGG